jgi:hypothetical protein
LLAIDTNLRNFLGPRFPSLTLEVMNFRMSIRCVAPYCQPLTDPLMGDFWPTDTFNRQKDAGRIGS